MVTNLLIVIDISVRTSVSVLFVLIGTEFLVIELASELTGRSFMELIIPSRQWQTRLKQLHKKQHNMQSLNALALSWAVRVNWGHMGRAVKCSCSSLTAHAALGVVFVGVPMVWGTLGRCWEKKNARLTSESSGWRLVPWARQHHCCQTPGPSLLLLEPPGSNPRHRTVKTHLVMERRSHWEAVIQFTSKKGGQKGTLTFRTNVFTQQFTLHLSMFINVSYLLTIHEQHWALREACYRTT